MEAHYGHMVRILHWCTDQVMTRALEEMELTAAQGHLLGYLASRQENPPCPRDIEEAFHLSHPTVSGLLARLEQKGFLETRMDSGDRRRKRIYLLKRGQQCDERIHQVIRENEERMIRGFTQAQREDFTAYLERAIENMGACTCHHPNKEESKK